VWLESDPQDLRSVGVLKSEEGEKMSYVQIVQRLPEEWRPVMLELVDAIRKDLYEQLAVPCQKFDDLKEVVQELAEAQKPTEQHVEELVEV
jgi:hypothetical protein